MKKIILSLAILLGMTTASHAKRLVLSSDNTLVLNGPFTDESTTGLMEDAKEMDANLKSGYPMYLFLNTPGGSIQAGLELFEFLNGLNRPVHTITLFAASMGFQTVQHLGNRYILKYGVLMAHKARGSFAGEFGGGISQLDSRYQLWLRRIELMDRQTVKRTNGKQTLKSYTDSYTPELWLNGEEAVKKGYADEVITLKCDLSLKGVESTVFSFGFFNIRAMFSKCPLQTAPLDVKARIYTNKGEMDLEHFLAKNGKFGPNCGKKVVMAPTTWGYTETVKKDDGELCAYDKTLTLDKINNAIKEKKKYLNRNFRDHIEYSY